MQGQPLTNEEIAAMSGAQAAPTATQAGSQSFVMPDMFASPGLTMVGGPQGEFSQQPPSASTAFEPPAPAPVSEKKSSSKKSDKKKSDKKKTSSKKKSKG